MSYFDTVLYVDSTAYAAVAQWTAAHAYAVGNIVRQLAAPTAGNERCYVCTAAGTSGSAEPTWTFTRGAIQPTDGTVKWQEITGLAAVNGDSADTSAWAASRGAVTLGAIIKNIAATSYFICTTAGTGGTGSEPVWNTTAGATTTDGTVTWTCLGAISGFTGTWKAPHARLATPVSSATWLAVNGMMVFVGDDHAESNAAGVTINQGSLSCAVLCVDHTTAVPPGPANLKTTASISFNGVSYIFGSSGPTQGSVYVYGLQFIQSGNFQLAAGNMTSGKAKFERSLFSLTSTGTASIVLGLMLSSTGTTVVEVLDSTFHLNQTSHYIGGGCANVVVRNCSVTIGAAQPNPLFVPLVNGGVMLVEGCDLSPVTTAIVGSNTNSALQMCIKDCKLNPAVASIAAVALAVNTLIDFNRCDAVAETIRNERYTGYGSQITTVSPVRTNGAVDGATPVSHRIVMSAGTGTVVFGGILCSTSFHPAIPLVIWNTVIGTNRNVMLYGIVNDSRVPNNDEVWFDVEYLGDAASPKGIILSGAKSNVLATGLPLTADNSAWNVDDYSAQRYNSTAYGLGQWIWVPDNASCKFYCTTAGVSAASEPAAYASAANGANVTDGTAVFLASSTLNYRNNSFPYHVGTMFMVASNPGLVFFCIVAGTSAASDPGYAALSDGQSIVDGTATMRAGCRFSQQITLSSPQPQLSGYLYAYPKIARANMTYWIDPQPVLS